jgi:hypothetical protein
MYRFFTDGNNITYFRSMIVNEPLILSIRTVQNEKGVYPAFCFTDKNEFIK